MPTPTGRAARKRYCGVECRKAAWRARHRDDPKPAAVPAVGGGVTAPGDDVPVPGGQHRCPHCHQPLAIITVLVPAAAATITTPEPHHG
jgi:hypothetical protein